LIEAATGRTVDLVSGGNAGSLEWALSGADTGRINNLRLGEALLLGREPLHRQPIDGLHTDVFTCVVEVIESKAKPSQPWGNKGQAAFEEQGPAIDQGDICQTIFALGLQDVDCDGLTPPPGIEILGSSSDHLITNSGGKRLPMGTEASFQVNYSALLRAMTSPFVTKIMNGRPDRTRTQPSMSQPGPDA